MTTVAIYLFCIYDYFVSYFMAAESDRESFMQVFKVSTPSWHSIRRNSLYQDVINLFLSESNIEYPLRIKYDEERAVDQGGVSRDMLSGFWEEAYKRLFDGCTLLTPVIHPHLDMRELLAVGRILSYGYLSCSFVPVRIAFPTLLCLLLGPTTSIPDSVIVETFPDCLSDYESKIIREAVQCSSVYSQSMKSKIISVLSRFGCREVPTCDNIYSVIVKVARYEFLVKPLAAISQIHSGIPAVHVPFWHKQSVISMRRLYYTLTATPERVVEILESGASNPCEERVMSYLEQFVGSMSKDMLRKFLRFTTGSSVCLCKRITVEFNGLTDFARRPLSHTCDCVLELSSTYTTYPEFVSEFEQVLGQPENCWTMDAL